LAIGVDVGRVASEATGAIVAAEAVTYTGIASGSRRVKALPALAAPVDCIGDAMLVIAWLTGV
jgi:hypothetical protein